MKKSALFLLVMIFSTICSAQWKPAGERILTPWGEKLTPESPLPEYPRPQMEREQWMSLNGLWDYAITVNGAQPDSWQGKILVPFAVESALSGVGEWVGSGKELWYSREFSIPAEWKGKRVLLNFGAVDWRADVWVNGIKAGHHTGGYTPFSIDITDALRKGKNELKVKVVDDTDNSWQPRGKQVAKPGGIWYTSVTGIWQSVWLEPVAPQYIESIRTTPDLDRKVISVEAASKSAGVVEVRLLDGDKTVARASALPGESADLYIPEPKLWSPSEPFLYDLEVSLICGGKRVDIVKSYAAMRKISAKRDAYGILRMQLNDKDLFQYGPLDQGWWPDGLYTAPSDEALAFDIIKTKELGFNMIRKHVKVESARWYYHCDRLGMLVWQDMPSGDKYTDWTPRDWWSGAEIERSMASEQNWRKEWKEVMDYLHNDPCIVVWVPFNEGWGQFKSVEMAEWTKNHDPSRLVNSASGGNHFLKAGDILDLHNYPAPEMYMYDTKRITVLGEYGGIGWPVEGHLWVEDRNWGYIKFNSSEEVTNEYVKYAEMLLEMIPKGFSAAVYTQTTDVEIEVNGLMTYDRKLVKPDAARIREINERICRALDK